MSRMLDALRQLEARHDQFAPPADLQIVSMEAPRGTEPEVEAPRDIEREAELTFEGLVELMNPPTSQDVTIQFPVTSPATSSPHPPAPIEVEPAPLAEAALAPHDDRSPIEIEVDRQLGNVAFAGQVRAMASAVIGKLPDHERGVVLAIGVETGEHSVLTLAHLATVLANTNRGDVLLIDGDVARRQLTTAFDCDHARGLTEVLGRTLAEGQLPIQSTATPRLSLVPAGKATGAWGAELDSRLSEFLSAVSQEWPWVLIHGGDAESPLTRHLASRADGVFLILRLGQTHSADAQETAATLRSTGAPLLGCIATNA